jgi:hypothetical protein
MAEWQPIETAPMDGTYVLALVNAPGVTPAVAKWETYPEGLGSTPRSQWRIREAEDFGTDDEWREDWIEARYEPTHWMPLPKPPLMTEEPHDGPL